MKLIVVRKMSIYRHFSHNNKKKKHVEQIIVGEKKNISKHAEKSIVGRIAAAKRWR